MTEPKNPIRYQGEDRRAPRSDAPSAGVARDGNALAPKRVEKIGGRHGAITTRLYNWHSYKNWADKMRGNFDEKK